MTFKITYGPERPRGSHRAVIVAHASNDSGETTSGVLSVEEDVLEDPNKLSQAIAEFKDRLFLELGSKSVATVLTELSESSVDKYKESLSNSSDIEAASSLVGEDEVRKVMDMCLNLGINPIDISGKDKGFYYCLVQILKRMAPVKK